MARPRHHRRPRRHPIRVPEGATDDAVVMKSSRSALTSCRNRRRFQEPTSAAASASDRQARHTSRRKWIRVSAAGGRARRSEGRVLLRLPPPRGAERRSVVREHRLHGDRRTGADARVVTASYPFTGSMMGWNRWTRSGRLSGASASDGRYGRHGPRHRHVDAQRAAARPARRRCHLRQGRAAAVCRRIGDARLRRGRRREADARRSIARRSSAQQHGHVGRRERRVHVHRHAVRDRHAPHPCRQRTGHLLRDGVCRLRARHEGRERRSTRGTALEGVLPEHRARHHHAAAAGAGAAGAANRDQDLHGKRRR